MARENAYNRDDPQQVTPDTNQSKEHQEVVLEARTRFDRCNEWESEWRAKFVHDVKFANGDSQNGWQWPNEIRTMRQSEMRPCLTMNLIKPHNRMISNEARKNKSSVRYIGMGNGATQEMANIYQDLHRYVEYHSQAQAAYTLAREFQIDGGRGYIRLATKYADVESFDIEPCILGVDDPLGIFLDRDCTRLDGLDSRYAFAFDDVDREEFEDTYPEIWDLVGHQPLGIGTTYSDWLTKSRIRVVEYFRKVPSKRKILSFVHHGERFTISHDRLEKLVLDREARDKIVSDPLTRHKEVWDDVVEWYLIAGERVIDFTLWPGKFIPIIPITGDKTTMDGRVDYKGHTRAMLDAQRMFNYNAALSIETPIPTPSGWTTMGQLEEGDWIFDAKGYPVQINKALPIEYGKECFKITFDNGYSIVTDEGHIWKVEERGKRTSRGETWNCVTRATGELSPGIHFIESLDYLKLEEKELPLDPYVLGLWLGDGSANLGRISAHEDDAEEEKAYAEKAGFTTSEISAYEGTKGVTFTILGLRRKLDLLGVLQEKHIPREYLRASRRQRLALLQGLMDTDGHFAQAVNQCVFVQVNEDIVRGFLELAASLGIKTTVQRQTEKTCGDYISKANWRIQFTADPDVAVFRLKRKAIPQTAGKPTHWRRTGRIGIKSIEAVSSVPVRCITLDTPDHLYLCGKGMIPTHNSAQVEWGALGAKAQWLAPIKAIEEFEDLWRFANQKAPAVLPYKHADEERPDVPLPPPVRIDPPNVAPAFQVGMENARQQFMMVTGQYENAKGEEGNERTGAAINARTRQGATATYHFQDNYEVGLVALGKQLLDLWPRLIDVKRVTRIVGDDGVEYDLELNPGLATGYLETRGRENKIIRKALNPLVGKFDIAAKVGPAYDSRREEAADALTLILTQAPQLTPILGDLLAKNLPFDGAEEAALRLRRMVPPQALGDGPSPQEQQLQAQVEALKAELTKLLNKNASDKVKLVGKAELRDVEVYKAETERFKVLHEAQATDQGLAQEAAGQLREDMEKTDIGRIPEENKAGEAVQVGAPPMPGMLAPDGEYYLPHPGEAGKWLKVSKRGGSSGG